MIHKNDREKERLETTSCPWQYTCECGTCVEADTKDHLDHAVRDHLLACQGSSKDKSPVRGRA